MLRLSKKTDYALLALRHLALAGSTGQTVPARELSETYDLPPELLAKVLQRLVRGGLLVSQLLTLYLTPIVYTYMAKLVKTRKIPSTVTATAYGFFGSRAIVYGSPYDWRPWHEICIVFCDQYSGGAGCAHPQPRVGHTRGIDPGAGLHRDVGAGAVRTGG